MSEQKFLADSNVKQYCTWTWTTQNGSNGVIVTGPNGKSIFMPAAGNYHGFAGEHGRYWSATAYPGDERSWAFFFGETDCYGCKDLRGTGIPVRPVTFAPDDNVLATPKGVCGTVDDGKVALTWTAVSGATSYAIFRSADGADYTQIGTSTTNTFVDEAPNDGMNYYSIFVRYPSLCFTSLLIEEGENFGERGVGGNCEAGSV